jgi:hypothetical protein
MKDTTMRYSLRATALSVTLLAAAATSTFAQGVANLPPSGVQPAAAPPAAVSGPAIGPNPGSNINIPSMPAFQKPADYDSNRAYHPYSTGGTGPNPGSNVSASNGPFAPPADSPANRPYSAGGLGPNPGGR